MSNFYLGIDGGGTKTLAALTDEKGRVLKQICMPGSNPNDIGIERSAEILLTCISFLTSGQLNEFDRLYIFAGISGGLNNKEKLTGILSEKYPRANIRVHSDAVSMISSEIFDGDGACVICGTGSVCFVKNGDKLIRIGGWGYLLDSAGDGFCIGRDVLDAVLRQHDGRGKETWLSWAVQAEIGRDPWDNITEIYDRGKPYIASFCHLAFEGAKLGDEVSREIISKNAAYIAELLNAAVKTVGKPLRVVMGGGVNIGCAPDWENSIAEMLDGGAEMIIPAKPPVFGSLVEALKDSGRAVTDEFINNFSESFDNEN